VKPMTAAPTEVHLVGSIGLDSVDDVFRALGDPALHDHMAVQDGVVVTTKGTRPGKRDRVPDARGSGPSRMDR